MAKITYPKGIKQRALAVADAYGIGHKELANSIGMTYSNFTGRAQETPLNSNAVAKILITYPRVNAHWLVTGVGDMLLEEVAATREQFEQMRKVIASQQRTIEKLAK